MFFGTLLTHMAHFGKKIMFSIDLGLILEVIEESWGTSSRSMSSFTTFSSGPWQHELLLGNLCLGASH